MNTDIWAKNNWNFHKYKCVRIWFQLRLHLSERRDKKIGFLQNLSILVLLLTPEQHMHQRGSQLNARDDWSSLDKLQYLEIAQSAYNIQLGALENSCSRDKLLYLGRSYAFNIIFNSVLMKMSTECLTIIWCLTIIYAARSLQPQSCNKRK